jgi:hypothetical protein
MRRATNLLNPDKWGLIEWAFCGTNSAFQGYYCMNKRNAFLGFALSSDDGRESNWIAHFRKKNRE